MADSVVAPDVVVPVALVVDFESVVREAVDVLEVVGEEDYAKILKALRVLKANLPEAV